MSYLFELIRSFSFGAAIPTPIPSPFINPTTFPAARFADVNTLLGILTPLVYIVEAFVFGSMLISAAYTIITAGGDKDKIAKSRSTATFAVLGIVVILLASLIVSILGFVTDINIPFL